MFATHECKCFAVATSAALVFDIVIVDKATVVVPHCKLVVILGFDVAAAYVVDVLDSRVVAAFHLALYLVVGTALNSLAGFEFHVDAVLLALSAHQEVLTELVHLMDQL